MCGRYYVDDETAKEIEKIVSEIDRKNVRRGEISPTNHVPIITSNSLIATWGFPNFKNKGVIINARSETAFERPMFRKSLMDRRCLIPASGFFEWNKEREKYYFTLQSQQPLYFCGIYNTFESELRFVILTTAANSTIADVHDRMPLILSQDKHEDWLYNNTATQLLLKEETLLLNRTSDYEQQRLDLF